MAHIADKLDFSGKRVLVSGASAAIGIGAAIARAFHGLGAHIINLDIADGTDLLSERFEFHRCDMANEEAVGRVLAAVGETHQRLDVLVNNAGIIGKARMEAFDMAEFARILQVNTVATAQLTKQCIPLLKCAKAGRIINIASVQAFIGTPVYSAYAASKAAVCGLTRVWAMELLPDHVNVNAICPGFVHTGMFERGIAAIMDAETVSRDEAIRRMVAECPQQRPLEPEEVGELAVLLGSDMLRGLTGQCIHLDGGMVL